MEIEVHTGEHYRRRGLATVTAAALIEACLQQGKQPNWDCFWDNAPSSALAQHMASVHCPITRCITGKKPGKGNGRQRLKHDTKDTEETRRPQRY